MICCHHHDTSEVSDLACPAWVYFCAPLGLSLVGPMVLLLTDHQYHMPRVTETVQYFALTWHHLQVVRGYLVLPLTYDLKCVMPPFPVLHLIL
jgi:hypothetical protein